MIFDGHCCSFFSFKSHTIDNTSWCSYDMTFGACCCSLLAGPNRAYTSLCSGLWHDIWCSLLFVICGSKSLAHLFVQPCARAQKPIPLWSSSPSGTLSTSYCPSICSAMSRGCSWPPLPCHLFRGTRYLCPWLILTSHWGLFFLHRYIDDF